MRARGASRWAVLVLLCSAEFLIIMDGLGISVALPSVAAELDLEERSLQWVLNAYLVPFGGLLLVAGRLGDVLGRHLMLVAGLLIFAAGSLVAGTTSSYAVLLLGRLLQGAGAAAAQPAALAVLAGVYSDVRERNWALGAWSAIGSAAIPAGAIAGGVLTDMAGWRWVLLINVPFAVVAAGLSLRWLPRQRHPAPFSLNVALSGLGITCALALSIAAVVRLGSGDHTLAGTLGMFGGSFALTLLFVRWERHSPAPLLLGRMHLTRARLLVNGLGAALPVGLGAVMFIGTLQLQDVLELSALQAGMVYLLLAVPVIVGSPLAARLANRLRLSSVAALGFSAQAAGLACLALSLVIGAPWPVLSAGFTLVGLGAPVAYVPLTTVAIDDEAGDSGLASGLFNTIQQVGNALAVAILAAVASSLGTGRATAYAASYGVGIAMLIAATGLSLTSLSKALSTRSHRFNPPGPEGLDTQPRRTSPGAFAYGEGEGKEAR